MSLCPKTCEIRDPSMPHKRKQKQKNRVKGLRGLGFRGLGFSVSGFRVSGSRVSGFRIFKVLGPNNLPFAGFLKGKPAVRV